MPKRYADAGTVHSGAHADALEPELERAQRRRTPISLLLVAPQQHARETIVSASFGVATLSPDSGAITIDAIIECAGRHLYAAKRSGRNPVRAGQYHDATLP